MATLKSSSVLKTNSILNLSKGSISFLQQMSIPSSSSMTPYSVRGFATTTGISKSKAPQAMSLAKTLTAELEEEEANESEDITKSPSFTTVSKIFKIHDKAGSGLVT